MNTSNNLPQLPPPRKNPGRWLYAAWLGVSILPLLVQPASATTIWEKATEIMKDVYQQILLIGHNKAETVQDRPGDRDALEPCTRFLDRSAAAGEIHH